MRANVQTLVSVGPYRLKYTGFGQIDFTAREYVGLLVYYLSGRTGALFPAP